MKHFAAAFCANGPYRKVKELLESCPDAWFPWGYRAKSVSESRFPISGDSLELWEINDIYHPLSAEPIAVARVDYVTVAQGYVALTLEAQPWARLRASSAEILQLAHEELLLAEIATADVPSPVS